MLAGHFGVSFAVKAVRKDIPLWVLIVAAQLLDFAWLVFISLDIEIVKINRALPSVALEFLRIPYSHSLLAAIIWTAIGYALYRACKGRKLLLPALLVAMAVLSHWFLDIVVHRHDLPVWPDTYVGFGVWDYPLIAFLLEGAILFAGIWWYLRCTVPHSDTGKYGAMIFGATMMLVQAGIYFGPAPTELSTVIIGVTLFYLVVASVSVWVDRQRDPISGYQPHTDAGPMGSLAPHSADSGSWLERILFVEAPDTGSLPPPTPKTEFVLTLFLRSDASGTGQPFKQYLRTDVANRISANQQQWGFVACRLFREISFHGVLTFFLNFTRSHGYVRFLCWVKGKVDPGSYKTVYKPYCDGVIELRFNQQPSNQVLEEIFGLFPKQGQAAKIISVASNHQYIVYDSGSTAPILQRASLCFLLRRPPGMSRSACQAYWTNRHAKLALRNMRYLGLTNYLQVLTLDHPDDRFNDLFDGMAYAQKSSLGRLLVEQMKLNTIRFNNTVVMDELNFSINTPVLLLRVSAII